MIPYKVFFPIVGALAALACGLAPAIAPVAITWCILGTVVIALGVVMATERLVHAVEIFAEWTIDAKKIAFRLIAFGVAMDGAIAVDLQLSGLGALPQALLMLVGATAAQVVTGALADAYLGRLRPRLIQARQERAQTPQAPSTANEGSQTLVMWPPGTIVPTESHDVLVMRQALRKVKLGWLVIKNAKPLHDGKSFFGIRFEVQITAEAMTKKDRRTLSTDSAEPIAVALSELLNQELETRWIGIQPLRRAGGYSITVTTQDVMARIYPFRDEFEWADITKPAVIGYGIDAKPITLHLRQHGQFIGKTRSGKTSLINCVLAYLTRCKNAVVWICGTEKLYDMLAGWLDPVYLDTGEEMPFDFVCVGPEDTAECLAALMRVARYRQSLRLHERANLPDIICILDEAMYALRNTTVTAEYDGQQLHMSAHAGNVMQGGGSAGCWLYYSTQRDTNDQLGPAGGDISAQTGFATAFGTQDTLSLGRQLGDFKLPPPEHAGEFYVKDDKGESYPVLTKGQYIQEDDPSKPVLHEGLKLSEVSWSRRVFKTHLDEGSQRAAGRLYAQRHTVVTMEFLDYLRKMKKPMTVVGQRPLNDQISIETEAAELAQKMGVDFASLSLAEREAFLEVAREMHEDVEGFDETPNGAPVNRTEQVIYVLRQAAGPLTSKEIFDALEAAGFSVKSENAVYNLLGQLVAKSVLTKDADRLYRLADG